MILRAAYRLKSDTSAPARHVDHEAADYDTAKSAAAKSAADAEVQDGEVLLHVRRIDAH